MVLGGREHLILEVSIMVPVQPANSRRGLAPARSNARNIKIVSYFPSQK